MKRLSIIMIVIVAVLTFVVPIYSATLISNPTGTTFGGALFLPSNAVTVAAFSIATEYVATAAHASSATKAGFEFGIESGSSVVKRKPWVQGDQWPLQSGSTSSLPVEFLIQ